MMAMKRMSTLASPTADPLSKLQKYKDESEKVRLLVARSPPRLPNRLSPHRKWLMSTNLSSTTMVPMKGVKRYHLLKFLNCRLTTSQRPIKCDFTPPLLVPIHFFSSITSIPVPFPNVASHPVALTCWFLSPFRPFFFLCIPYK